MPVNPGDTIRLTCRGSCFGQRIMLDLSYEVTVGNAVLTTAQVLDELLNEAGGAGAQSIQVPYRACLPPQYSLEEMRAQVISPIRSAFRSTLFAGFAGTNLNPATSATRQGAITRRTANAGRNQVSTLKIGPAPDAAFANGLVTAAYAATLSTMGTASLGVFLLPVSTVQMVPTILTPNGASLGRVLNNFFVQQQSRVMSRRVVGRGE